MRAPVEIASRPVGNCDIRVTQCFAALLTTDVRLRTIQRMEDRPFRVGDRIEWIGPSIGPPPHFPRHCERGWLVMIHPMDDIVVWDYCGDDSGDFTTSPYVRRVGDRNEPGPEKWLPGDPFYPAEDD